MIEKSEDIVDSSKSNKVMFGFYGGLFVEGIVSIYWFGIVYCYEKIILSSRCIFVGIFLEWNVFLFWKYSVLELE